MKKRFLAILLACLCAVPTSACSNATVSAPSESKTIRTIEKTQPTETTALTTTQTTTETTTTTATTTTTTVTTTITTTTTEATTTVILTTVPVIETEPVIVQTDPPAAVSATLHFILNTNTNCVHISANCSAAKRINPENYAEIDISEEDLYLYAGQYWACGKCSGRYSSVLPKF